MKITVTNILIGIVCIVVANLLLVFLRTQVSLPLSPGIQSAIACGVGVLVWFLIVARMKR